LTYTLHAVARYKLKLGTAYPYEGFILILTATYGMTRSRNCGLQKIFGGGGVGDFRGGVSPPGNMPG